MWEPITSRGETHPQSCFREMLQGGTSIPSWALDLGARFPLGKKKETTPMSQMTQLDTDVNDIPDDKIGIHVSYLGF